MMMKEKENCLRGANLLRQRHPSCACLALWNMTDYNDLEKWIRKRAGCMCGYGEVDCGYGCGCGCELCSMWMWMWMCGTGRESQDRVTTRWWLALGHRHRQWQKITAKNITKATAGQLNKYQSSRFTENG